MYIAGPGRKLGQILVIIDVYSEFTIIGVSPSFISCVVSFIVSVQRRMGLDLLEQCSMIIMGTFK